MKKLPYLEVNLNPSNLNTSKNTGAASQLQTLAENKPNYDGVSIENMRNNPLYAKVDDIDKVGLAQKALLDAGAKVKSKTKAIRAFNDHAQKLRIPNNKK